MEREDYHKRKFSGRPLQQIKRKAKAIFFDAKMLLREHKQDGVSGSDIDEMCDEVTALLTSSLDFFDALLKFPATNDDVENAEEKKKHYMHLVRNSVVLKGNVTVKGHIIDAHAIPWMRKCKELNLPLSKIIEQFVELNHQMGKQIDEQSKRIVSAEIMANSMAKRKALEYHCEVNARITLVHEDASRGEYKKSIPSPIMPTENHQPPSSMQVTPPPREKTVRVDGATISIRELLSFKKGCHH